MGQDHWCKSHGPLPQVQGLLLEQVLCCVVLHQWTGAYQGRPLGQQPCHPCKTIIVSFRFSTTNCFSYWYWVATYRASRWCNLAIRDCTLNLTLKWPVNLWAVFTWAFIGWNCNLRDSTLDIQPGVNCHPHFYCVNYSRPWKIKY